MRFLQRVNGKALVFGALEDGQPEGGQPEDGQPVVTGGNQPVTEGMALQTGDGLTRRIR